MRFSDKVVVVTGGASGIGKAAALEFAREGAIVAVNDLRADAAEATRLEIEQGGGRAIVISGDISDETDVRANVRTVIDQFGRIDILISNAGLSNQGRAEDYEGWERSISVNLSGHFYWARTVARESMIPNCGGSIIFISSGAGLGAVLNDVGYVACKHAIIGLNKALALEWTGFGIRVNCIAPGVIDTEMLAQWKASPAYATRVDRVPMQRLGLPIDLAHAMMFLASDDAAYITGAMIPVDGGQQALHSGMPAHR
jgi:NAD(P)-dependent dehydrogenase (short-subunit alcohol dehydrogenase family)